MGMRNQTVVPIGPFKALFESLIQGSFIDDVLQRCGVRRRRRPTLAAVELIQSLVFHVIAEAGTLAQHVQQLTGIEISDSALAQRRALLPIAVFDEIMRSALQPKADPQPHPEAFYHGLRLCAVDGSTFSVTNTPQVKKQMRKAKSRRGKAAFPKVGVAVLLELGLHNPLAAAMPVLKTLNEPLLAPIRRIMPNLGGLDLSPLALLILAQIALMVLNRVSFALFGV